MLGNVTPAAACTASLMSILSFFLLSDAVVTTAFALFLLFMLCGVTTSWSPISIALKWIVPFVVPLLLVHTFLNSSFQVDGVLGNVLPYRLDGLEFGINLSAKFALLAIAATFFVFVLKSDLVEFLLRAKAPLQLVLLGTLGLSVSTNVKRRIDNIYSAQQAKGINVGPRLRDRVKAFPSIMIPVTISTLLESDQRVGALSSRGLGSGDIKALQATPFSWGQWATLVLPMVGFVLAIIADRFFYV